MLSPDLPSLRNQLPQVLNLLWANCVQLNALLRFFRCPVFSLPVASPPTKPSSNKGLKEHIKHNRHNWRVVIAPDHPNAECCWVYITAQLDHLPSPASYLFLPQVLFAGLLHTGNKNTIFMINDIKSTSHGTFYMDCSPGTKTIMKSWRADTCGQPESWERHPGFSSPSSIT